MKRTAKRPAIDPGVVPSATSPGGFFLGKGVCGPVAQRLPYAGIHFAGRCVGGGKTVVGKREASRDVMMTIEYPLPNATASGNPVALLIVASVVLVLLAFLLVVGVGVRYALAEL